MAFTGMAQAYERDWQGKINGSPVAEKLRFWLQVTDTDRAFDAATLMRFTLENPNWPRLHIFRGKIEEDINALKGRNGDIAAWFDQNPPKTAQGFRAYMNALLTLGFDDKARAALNAFWTDAELNRAETTALAEDYKRYFTGTAHIDRLDNLLWKDRYREAEHMTALVDGPHVKLTEARKELGRLSSRAPQTLTNVPAALQNNPGLLFERLRWQRIKTKDKYRFDILESVGSNMGRPEEWWKERNIIVRRALEKRNHTYAYRIAAEHGMTAGSDYAQAEWLAGWIALRLLQQPDVAWRHFERMYNAVTSAVSRSRGAYWLGRAAETMQKEEAAGTWYKVAAQFPSTFYGQLAAKKLQTSYDATVFPDETVASERTDIFESNDLVRAIRLLARQDLKEYTNPFFAKLLENARDRSDFALVARLARDIGHTRYTVEANKQVQQKTGEFLFNGGYPLLPSLPVSKPESALVHAIIHRESMFEKDAESPAGAKGLMQLMPATARQVARSIGHAYSANRLTESPRYNIELGAAYLQSLLDDYGGFYPMAIAAYNAGPGNVRKWVNAFGNPRNDNVDIIDWIEQIPIYETRNYVQRVMESYYMYRLRLGAEPVTVMDIKR